MLAAGFVIGPDGRSIQSIASCTGVLISSKTIHASVSYPRDCREFCFKGRLDQVVAAVAIVEEAVQHYKFLTEGPCCGLSVERIQKVSGIDFVYHPPPRSAAPEAARLRNPSKKVEKEKTPVPSNEAQPTSLDGGNRKACISPTLFALAPGEWTYNLTDSSKLNYNMCSPYEDFDFRDSGVTESTKQASYRSSDPTPANVTTCVDVATQLPSFQWPATPEKIFHKTIDNTVQSKRKKWRNIHIQDSSNAPSVMNSEQMTGDEHLNTPPLLMNAGSNEFGSKALISSIANEERIEILKSVALSLGFKSLDLVLKH